ncbi:unnamed protein product [Choristocarpus tenellus]
MEACGRVTPSLASAGSCSISEHCLRMLALKVNRTPNCIVTRWPGSNAVVHFLKNGLTLPPSDRIVFLLTYPHPLGTLMIFIFFNEFVSSCPAISRMALFLLRIPFLPSHHLIFQPTSSSSLCFPVTPPLTLQPVTTSHPCPMHGFFLYVAPLQISLALQVEALQRQSAELRQSLPHSHSPFNLENMHQSQRSSREEEMEGKDPFREQGDLAYKVCYKGGVAIRSRPDVAAPSVGEVLEWGEGIWASERMARIGEEEIYVRLRDGRGWVFEWRGNVKVLERVFNLPPPCP